jgi:hypothetical protein
MLVLFCSFFKPEQIDSKIRQDGISLRNTDQSPVCQRDKPRESDRVGLDRQQLAIWLPQ